jgi:hypothetical protein
VCTYVCIYCTHGYDIPAASSRLIARLAPRVKTGAKIRSWRQSALLLTASKNAHMRHKHGHGRQHTLLAPYRENIQISYQCLPPAVCWRQHTLFGANKLHVKAQICCMREVRCTCAHAHAQVKMVTNRALPRKARAFALIALPRCD